jgi:predicted transposase YbfD/YdcC
LHPLCEIFFLVLVALICGCNGWKDIEDFGWTKLAFLRKFYSYDNGIPSDDTMRRLFRRLSMKAFSLFFRDWVKSINLPKKSFIAIDGKTSRSSVNNQGKQLHMVSAFVGELRLVLGQQKTDEKSNEITAIPKLLKILNIEDAIVTIDAMGCQKEICESILEKEADYCIALKGNQPILHQTAMDLFANERLKKKEITVKDRPNHGRQEERIYKLLTCPQDILEKHADWPGLVSMIEVTSKRIEKGKETNSTRHYISSLNLNNNLKRISRAIRSHWSIENNLHWTLDTAFKDDESTIRKGKAANNITVMKHFALNLLQKSKTKDRSIPRMRRLAGWDEQALMTILSGIWLQRPNELKSFAI